jgi:uncharacterized SAM-binding protein YcdF (DUF218 family)
MKKFIRIIYSYILDPSFWIYIIFISICFSVDLVFGLFLFLAIPILFNFLPFILIRKYEIKFKVIQDGDLSFHHILVLGGGHQPNHNLIFEQRLNETSLRRVVESVRLGKLFPDSLTVMSGEQLKKDHPSQAELQGEMARLFGVDANKLVLISEPFNTEEEAVFYFRKFGFHSIPILLVTKAIHMDRAKFIFSNYNYNIIPAPSYFIHLYYEPKLSWFFKPDFGLILHFRELIKERVGIIWLRIKIYLGIQTGPIINYDVSKDIRKTSFEVLNR